MAVLFAPKAGGKGACALGADKPCLPCEASWGDGLFRRAVLDRLATLGDGVLTIVDGRDCHVFGTGGELRATVMVHRSRFYRRIALGGAIGAAESYMDGDWSTEDLVAVLRLFARNAETSQELDRANPVVAAISKCTHWLRRNTKLNSRRNIAAHYDLGNEFFELFLDETRTYSCGFFESPTVTMRDASLAKINRLCRKLQLTPDDHLVEIGTGWGALAIHAAENYGCRVTTTTISAKQHEYTERLIAERGLTHRITLVNVDYRDLSGQFDKLVSVEMIEAVGHEYLPTFFRKFRDLLKPGGRAAIQAITIRDEQYDRYRRSVDFIQKYIFPGGCLPSMGVMSKIVAQQTGLRISDREELRSHYAITLERWRDAFWKNIDRVRSLGLPDEFIRMWNWYFCYCEAAFREQQIGLSQIVLDK